MTPISVQVQVPSDQVVQGRVDGSRVLFNLDDRRLHFLNETAEAVWDGIRSGESPDAIAEQLAARFGTDFSLVRRDVAELVDRLGVDRLVVHDDHRRRATSDRPARLSPGVGTPFWPSTGSYRALDATIRIETEDLELGDVIAAALAPLSSEEPADCAIRIDSQNDDCWKVTTRAGEPVIVGGRLPAAIRALGEVNAAAIESVPRQLVMHAGAVATAAGALLLPAGPNQGKSTLTTALVRDGMAYLTDEAAAVTRDGLCRPYAKAIALEPGSFEVHPDLAPSTRGGLGAALDSRVWHVGPDRVGSVGETAPVIAIVFPRWRPGSATILTPCTPAEAMPALVGEAFNFGRGGQLVFDILCDLVGRVPAWRLEYGDGDEAVEVIRSLPGLV